MNYKTILTALVALLFPLGIHAQGETETRSFMKSIPSGRATRVELVNKYGSMHITTWNKDSVYIRAEIKGFAPNRERLKKMFDGISVNFTEARDLLRVQTDFSQGIGMLFENFKGMTSKYISYDSKVEINYYVNVPDYINLKVDSKYGDVFMEDNKGETSVAVANGSLKAGSLEKGARVTLSFCDASIASIASGTINSSFSELSVSEAGDLSITSMSSRYELKKIESLNIESRRDKFFIDETGKIKGSSYFSEFKIGGINDEITLSSRYGNFDADKISKGFSSVNINSGYTDVELEFEENSSFSFEIRELGSFVALPSENVRSEQKTINADKKEYMTFGTFGSGQGSSKVKIDATRGKVYLR